MLRTLLESPKQRKTSKTLWFLSLEGLGAEPVLAREREARLNVRSLSQACFKQLYVADFVTIMCIVPCTSKHLVCTSCGLRPRLRRCLDHIQHVEKSSCNAMVQPRCIKPCLKKIYQNTKQHRTSDEHLPQIDPLRASETTWPLYLSQDRFWPHLDVSGLILDPKDAQEAPQHHLHVEKETPREPKWAPKRKLGGTRNAINT